MRLMNLCTPWNLLSEEWRRSIMNRVRASREAPAKATLKGLEEELEELPEDEEESHDESF